MLFTSALFAFVYLPIVLFGFFALGRYSSRFAAMWLFFASVVFYGYWMPEFTILLLGSICWNFGVGSRISALINNSDNYEHRRYARRWLIIGISLNLLLLGYFKYANFFIDNLMLLSNQHWQIERIILPIGISFFTFTQIAFLADTYQQGIREYAFVHYGLFVTYFPHLIAGPVLHHAQMMPQFREAKTYKINTANIAGGLAIFAMGLFKKIVLADGISPYADAIFNAAELGSIPSFNEAWIAALAYTFQLYFDFSGYSDMAIGLSWMFNVKLPYNFNSPYQASSISEFWRRWHISLSSFLREYLYIPLGGNRKGPVRRYLNLIITMLLGGLWHGASWNFVFWGGLHGGYLVINHGFQAIASKFNSGLIANWLFKWTGWLLTMLLVIIAWVFFRATSFSSALTILNAMANIQSVTSLNAIHPMLWNLGLAPDLGLLFCLILGGLAFLLPNSNHLGEQILSFCRGRTSASPIVIGMSVTIATLFVLMNSLRSSVSAFIYFNF
ncbi:MAG: MBOAT family O-acyltransferase [Methylococcales bacterium]